MPKQTFFNLPDEKKERLLKAAYSEFSKVSLDESSINAIIHESGISRGSFYQYFEDKEDLYFYCAHLLKKDEKAQVDKCFEVAEGNLFDGLKRTFDILYDSYTTGPNKDFYHHFFVNMTYRKSRNIYDEKNQQPVKPHKHEYPDIVRMLDQSTLNFSSEQELQDFLQYTFQIIHWTIARSFLKKLSKEEAHEEVNQRLTWLENGIIKNKGG
ncbi:MAG: TetR/AcrR family transcriptional regulator [Lactobacillales bacterium]|uniref:TetR/AcrR family transcriptional regulator n=1 Tax=Jeotgalibaca porci TaxID=1868793 RepID=UPI0016982490|nr:TetR/AcrR family transcriptional regulator [Lactobacillales bacterium]